MVICFLIHTVCPVSALSAGESRILYARVFGPETGAGKFTPEQRRLMHVEKLHVLARPVRSAVAQSREASGDHTRTSCSPREGFATLHVTAWRSYVCWDLVLSCYFQVLLKSDRVDALLHRLLPHGQLLFLNHRFDLTLDKEIASYMSK
ncbi:hypothetical protein cypCar_00004544 [Cyprinus carpio]|nr:hypothetical protein cypCar_00004544 [Cyprinus carpio]